MKTVISCLACSCFIMLIKFRQLYVLFEPFCVVNTVLLFIVFTVLYLC